MGSPGTIESEDRMSQFFVGFMTCFALFLLMGAISVHLKQRATSKGPNSKQDVGEQITIVKEKG